MCQSRCVGNDPLRQSADFEGIKMTYAGMCAIAAACLAAPWQNYGKCVNGDEVSGTGKMVPSAGQSGE
jgi:hypothetical protein